MLTKFDYLICISIIKSLLNKGLINIEEYNKIKYLLDKEFSYIIDLEGE